MDEDEGAHEDLNEHEVSEEASDSDEGQQEFDESSDEVSLLRRRERSDDRKCVCCSQAMTKSVQMTILRASKMN